ncbi:MAG: glycosyltransferase family 2 protein [Victivallales bacterium]|jgi:glycosyltransferase involved in cell wall biosynthesis|nr:glycosyltransferase family 2 protein [Victivallales bacterium]
MVSIVIPSRNNEERIGRTLAAFFAQNRRDFEVVSCDDHSIDRTCAILDYYPEVRKITMPEGQHLPGELLNRAVSEARGDIVVINHADVCPLDADYLHNLVTPLEKNSSLSAVFACQESSSDSPLPLRCDIARKFAVPQPAFSLCSAAIRRDVALDLPFSTELPLAFSLEWATRLEQAKGKIAYVPEARVEYSPNISWLNLWKFFRLLGECRTRVTGEKLHIRSVLSKIAIDSRADLRLAKLWRNFSALPGLLVWRIVEHYAYYCGNRAAQKGVI